MFTARLKVWARTVVWGIKPTNNKQQTNTRGSFNEVRLQKYKRQNQNGRTTEAVRSQQKCKTKQTRGTRGDMHETQEQDRRTNADRGQTLIYKDRWWLTSDTQVYTENWRGKQTKGGSGKHSSGKLLEKVNVYISVPIPRINSSSSPHPLFPPGGRFASSVHQPHQPSLSVGHRDLKRHRSVDRQLRKKEQQRPELRSPQRVHDIQVSAALTPTAQKAPEDETASPC